LPRIDCIESASVILACSEKLTLSVLGTGDLPGPKS
jgi:hypothetical protein